MKETTRGNIQLKLPVKVSYHVLEKISKERMVGENIQVEKENGEITRYAKILDIQIFKSTKEGYDLSVIVDFVTLTSFFGNKKGSLLLDAAVFFNYIDQEISVVDYNIKVESSSWLMNKTLQAVANTIIKGKLQKKMKVDIRPHLEEQVLKLNKKLTEGFEPVEGISLTGNLLEFTIYDIIPGGTHLLVKLNIQGDTVVDVTDIRI